MGATAFQMIGGGKDRSFDKWQATEQQYLTALKAVNTEKGDRYQTIDEYYKAWNKA